MGLLIRHHSRIVKDNCNSCSLIVLEECLIRRPPLLRNHILICIIDYHVVLLFIISCVIIILTSRYKPGSSRKFSRVWVAPAPTNCQVMAVSNPLLHSESQGLGRKRRYCQCLCQDFPCQEHPGARSLGGALYSEEIKFHP